MNSLLDCPKCRQDCTEPCAYCESRRWIAEALEVLRCRLAAFEAMMEWEDIYGGKAA